jgi:hypothetical protein
VDNCRLLELFGLIELRVVTLLFIHWRLKLANVHHLLTFFFTEQFLPLFWKSPASSSQPEHNSSWNGGGLEDGCLLFNGG